jgi:hypothetical protein
MVFESFCFSAYIFIMEFTEARLDEDFCEQRVSLFQWPDYVVCGLMLLVSAGIGIYFGWQARKTKATTDEILMGGRNMPTFPMAMSLLAR